MLTMAPVYDRALSYSLYWKFGPQALLGPPRRPRDLLTRARAWFPGGEEFVSNPSRGCLWTPRTVLSVFVHGTGVRYEGCPASSRAFDPPLANDSIVRNVPPLTWDLDAVLASGACQVALKEVGTAVQRYSIISILSAMFPICAWLTTFCFISRQP